MFCIPATDAVGTLVNSKLQTCKGAHAHHRWEQLDTAAPREQSFVIAIIGTSNADLKADVREHRRGTGAFFGVAAAAVIGRAECGVCRIRQLYLG